MNGPPKLGKSHMEGNNWWSLFLLHWIDTWSQSSNPKNSSRKPFCSHQWCFDGNDMMFLFPDVVQQCISETMTCSATSNGNKIGIFCEFSTSLHWKFLCRCRVLFSPINFADLCVSLSLARDSLQHKCRKSIYGETNMKTNRLRLQMDGKRNASNLTYRCWYLI